MAFPMLLGCFSLLVLPLAAQEKAPKAKPEPQVEAVKEISKPGKVLINVLESAPYTDKGFGRAKLVDEKQLQLMQIALLPGQAMPKHKANSHVHILILEGEILAGLNGVDTRLRKGDLIPVAFGTPMFIRNESKEKATFTVWKTPNPSEMDK